MGGIQPRELTLTPHAPAWRGLLQWLSPLSGAALAYIVRERACSPASDPADAPALGLVFRAEPSRLRGQNTVHARHQHRPRLVFLRRRYVARLSKFSAGVLSVQLASLFRVEPPTSRLYPASRWVICVIQGAKPVGHRARRQRVTPRGKRSTIQLNNDCAAPRAASRCGRTGISVTFPNASWLDSITFCFKLSMLPCDGRQQRRQHEKLPAPWHLHLCQRTMQSTWGRPSGLDAPVSLHDLRRRAHSHQASDGHTPGRRLTASCLRPDQQRKHRVTRSYRRDVNFRGCTDMKRIEYD